MTALTPDERRVVEGGTPTYSCILKDQNSEVIDSGDLTTLTLTLYDFISGTIINSRSKQDILNKNNVTIDGNGLLTWDMVVADNAIMGTSVLVGGLEQHVALFEYTWGVAKAWKHEVKFDVLNLAKVPTV